MLYARNSTTFEAADSSLIPYATAAASAGDIDWTHRLIEESLEQVRRSGSDDGLPDLLVPFAMLAWRLDDETRARGMLTAVKYAGRPTSNIASTIAYRWLRQFVVIRQDRPADLDPAAELQSLIRLESGGDLAVVLPSARPIGRAVRGSLGYGRRDGRRTREASWTGCFSSGTTDTFKTLFAAADAARALAAAEGGEMRNRRRTESL